MDGDAGPPLVFFEPAPVRSRRHGPAIWRWVVPLVLSVITHMLVTVVCTPSCCDAGAAWWDALAAGNLARAWALWVGRRWFWARWLVAGGCHPYACSACWFVLPTAFCVVAAILWTIIAVLLSPVRHQQIGWAGMVEVDPDQRAHGHEVWYCPAELASFVREKMLFQQRTGAALLRLKAAVSRWMDDHGVPGHTRHRWMEGAMAAALVLSPEERDLLRLSQRLGDGDHRQLARLHQLD